jgi:hypothetical protein
VTRNPNAPQLRWTNLVPNGAELDWMEDGLCHKFPDIDAWFPDTTDWKTGVAQEAVAVCMQCPVRLKCLQYALDVEQTPMGPIPGSHRYGIYGGYSATERARIALGKSPTKRAEMCRNGHRYTPETTRSRTYSDGSVSRICMVCEQIGQERRRKKSA